MFKAAYLAVPSSKSAPESQPQPPQQQKKVRKISTGSPPNIRNMRSATGLENNSAREAKLRTRVVDKRAHGVVRLCIFGIDLWGANLGH